VNLHYIPVHTQPSSQDLGFTEGEFPESEQYYREAISLPMFHGMTEAQQNMVVDVFTDLLKGA
jgi:dTDP-4-amino-4,6-dideoxygalactose transaminase